MSHASRAAILAVALAATTCFALVPSCLGQGVFTPTKLDFVLRPEYAMDKGFVKSVADLGIGTRDEQIKARLKASHGPILIKAVNPDDGIKRSQDKTVYGENDRVPIYNIADEKAKANAIGVASMSAIGERDVYARGYCTAFLVSKDKVLTASHCVNFNDYRTKAIRFNDFLRAPGLQGGIDSYEIAGIEVWDFLHDFAILRLNANRGGKLPGEAYPILELDKTEAAERVGVYMIGFGAQEYLSYAGNCSVVRTTYRHPSGKYTFGVDCDAHGGNSGSPIFNAQTHKVIGVLWGGQQDDRVIPTADANTHEFAVPVAEMTKATKFDSNTPWPPDVRIIGRSR